MLNVKDLTNSGGKQWLTTLLIIMSNMSAAPSFEYGSPLGLNNFGQVYLWRKISVS